jgi:hypothetical protein
MTKQTQELILHQLPMPGGITLHNACNEPCDMAEGLCRCGAWHNLKDWPANVFTEIEKATEADREPRNASDRAPLSVGAVELEQYVANSIRKARKLEHDSREGYCIEDYGPQHWEGYSAALMNLRKWLRRKLRKAPADNPAICGVEEAQNENKA